MSDRPRRPRRPSPDEMRVWKQVVRDADPMPGRAAQEDGVGEPPPDLQPSLPPGRLAVQLPAPRPSPPADLPGLTHGALPNVDRRTAQRMRRGQMVVDATLDLHGHSRAAAHAALASFISASQAAGHRCVLVVTGKGLRDGTGVLRSEVPQWLNDAGLRAHILGFSHARPQHGGDGALYVLLKRRR